MSLMQQNKRLWILRNYSITHLCCTWEIIFGNNETKSQQQAILTTLSVLTRSARQTNFLLNVLQKLIWNKATVKIQATSKFWSFVYFQFIFWTKNTFCQRSPAIFISGTESHGRWGGHFSVLLKYCHWKFYSRTSPKGHKDLNVIFSSLFCNQW